MTYNVSTDLGLDQQMYQQCKNCNNYVRLCTLVHVTGAARVDLANLSFRGPDEVMQRYSAREPEKSDMMSHLLIFVELASLVEDSRMGPCLVLMT